MRLRATSDGAQATHTRRARLWRWGLASYALGVVGFYLVMLLRFRREARARAPLVAQTALPPQSLSAASSSSIPLLTFATHAPDGDQPATSAASSAISNATPDASPAPTGPQATPPPPKVSVIVPARDEQRDIWGCVATLLAQDYPNFEVIVVDDASTDDTPRLLDKLLATPRASGGRLRVVHVASLPDGWAGKPHALHVGATAATGDWLLFTDADTRHAPSALRIALERAQRDHADLFSIISGQDLPDFWSRVITPIAAMGITAMYPPDAINDPLSDVALANGQFLLIRRAMYDAVGGYARPELRATLVDDRDLALTVKRAGGRLELLDGQSLVHTRMYRNLREAWNGWGKNAYLGSRGGLFFFPLLIVGLLLVGVAPFALMLAGLAWRRPAPTLAGAFAVAAALAYRMPTDRSLGIPARYAWAHPLGAAIFTGILARSYWRRLTGWSVPWRGRAYAL